MANVSVAKRTLMSPLQKSISTISFMMGRSPAWCTPTPRLSISRTRSTCGRLASEPLSRETHFSKKTWIWLFSLAVVRSRECMASAAASILFLEKQNTTAGRRSPFFRMVSRSASWLFSLFQPPPPRPPGCAGVLAPALPGEPRPRPWLPPPLPVGRAAFASLFVSGAASSFFLESAARLSPCGRNVSWRQIGKRLPPWKRLCSRGTGRRCVPVTWISLRLVRPTQLANSSTLGTVALSRMMLTWAGSMMITSSQTTPRSASFT
mmetsp:Transcript_2275/g.5364  ORF Transcript_2275/g.5364 Transcript_2275/m.5364 type:complete len:264 (-) Transcript_2275:641-1432(-)